jgi:seryl-tRNA synthetase
MQLSIDISLIIGLLGVATGIISYITAANKLRFEVDSLKKENTRQFDLIDQNRKDILFVKENGSMHSEGLKSRVEKLEERMKDIDQKLGDLSTDIKGIAIKFDMFITPPTMTKKNSRKI